MRYIHPRVGTKGRNRGGKKSCWHSGSRDPGTGTWGEISFQRRRRRRSFLRGRIVSREFTVPTPILRLHFFAYVQPVTDQPVQKLIFKDSPTLTLSRAPRKSSIPLPDGGGRGRIEAGSSIQYFLGRVGRLHMSG